MMTRHHTGRRARGHGRERRKPWGLWKTCLAGLAGFLLIGVILDGANRLLPGHEERQAVSAERQREAAEARAARQAAQTVQRRIREAARLARQSEREAAAGLARAEEARREAIRDAVCQRTLSCWAARHMSDAQRACRTSLESLARFQSRWVSRIGEGRFTQYDWLDGGETGRLVYAGDRIELQNGLGVWQRHVYTCAYDPHRQLGHGLSMQPGRL